MAFNPIVGKAALGDHTLKQGMTSKDVQQLQTVLKKKDTLHIKRQRLTMVHIRNQQFKSFKKQNG